MNADDDSNIYDAAYESTYYNASNVSSYGTPSECQSAKMRSIFYEDVNECQEISCYVEGAKTTFYIDPSVTSYRKDLSHLLW